MDCGRGVLRLTFCPPPPSTQPPGAQGGQPRHARHGALEAAGCVVACEAGRGGGGGAFTDAAAPPLPHTGLEWKDLDDEDKEPFAALAAKDKERYEGEKDDAE